ncbi:unnamed protein product [Symbiodinium sp. CCMP2592]|nr:unnamed protein product [Symbiodinium sp. CCMP2592]
MGRGDKYKWSAWQDDSSAWPSSSGQWPTKGGAKYKNGKGSKGKWQDWDYNQPQSSSFPSFEEMQPRQPRQPTKMTEAIVIPEDEPDAGHYVNGVQRALNGVRRATMKVRKLDKEAQQLDAKWEAFQQNLQESFALERRKYRDRKKKLAEQMDENLEMKTTALAELKEVMEKKKQTPQPKETQDLEAMEELRGLLLTAGQEDDEDIATILMEACHNSDLTKETARQNILTILEEHKKKECPRTPESRGVNPAPRTPPAAVYAPNRTAMEVDKTIAGNEGTTLSDPYLTSPSGPGMLPSPPTREHRSKSRSSTRTPIKFVGRKPHLGRVSGTPLSTKLSERREAAMVNIAEDSEEDLIGHLEKKEAATRLGCSSVILNLNPDFFGQFRYEETRGTALREVLCLGHYEGCDNDPARDLTALSGDNDGQAEWPHHIIYYMLTAGLCGWLNGLHFVMGGTLLAVYLSALFRCLGRRRLARGCAGAVNAKALLIFGMLSIAETGRTTTSRPTTSPPRKCWSEYQLPVPRQTDLELWTSGQLTAREQQIRASDQWLAELPLQHSEGEIAPPNLTMPVHREEEGLHLLTEAEMRATHISVWIASPFFEVEVLDLGIAFPMTEQRFLDAVRGTTTCMPDWAETVLPTTPQVGPYYGSCVAIPPWIPAAGKSVLVIDNRPIGGHTFPFYHEGLVTLAALKRQVPQDDENEVDFYAFGGNHPLGEIGVDPIQGGLIKAVYKGEPCNRAQHVVYQGPEEQLVYEDLPGAEEHRIDLALSHAGRSVYKQIAVNPGPRSTREDDPSATIVFLDLRGLTHFPQWVQLTGDLFNTVEYLEGIQVPSVPGWTVVIEGGEATDDPEVLRVQDGETLNFFMKADEDLTPSPAASHEEDPDEEGSSDDPPDPMDTSDDSVAPPLPDGRPRGPPPPRPVNRSRSPRRHQDDPQHAELSLAAMLPSPTFDLTRTVLQWPHQSTELNSWFHPWGPAWLNWNLDGVRLHPTASDAVQSSVHWADLLPEIMQGTGEFHIYTDGSAQESTARSGYAVVILVKVGAFAAVLGLLGGQIMGNTASPWYATETPALYAEQVALASALLWVLQARAIFPSMRCHLFVDCLSAGNAATGQWDSMNRLGAQTRDLEIFMRELDGLKLDVSHIKSHVGNAWNELADCIAKSAMQGCSTFAEATEPAVRAFLQQDISWLRVELAAARTGSLWLENGGVCWNEQPYPPSDLTPGELVPTADQLPHQASDRHVEFSMQTCTYNVQGLGGNHRYMEEQFAHHDFGVVFLQETKQQGGHCNSQRYYRLASDAQIHWGTAIWLRRRGGFISVNGDPVIPAKENIKVIHQEPRMLAIAIQIGRSRLGLISAHCPHASKSQERDLFMQQFEKLCGRLRDCSLLLCGVDLNGRVPPNQPQVTGALEAEEPDATGRRFVEILGNSGVWIPSTFPTLHEGTTTTYVHPSGTESRIDYIGAGGRARIVEARSWVCSDIDNCSPNEDHSAVALQVCGQLPLQGDGRRLRKERFDVDKLWTENGRKELTMACESFVQPSWQEHPDRHCQNIQQHLVQHLRHHFGQQPTHGRASYIPEEVWTLRQRKNCLRWRSRERRTIWRRLQRLAFQRWKHGESAADEATCWAQATIYEVVAAAIRFATGRIKRIIAQAKDAFLRGVAAEGHQGVSAIMQRVKAAGLGAKAKRSFGRTLPRLLHPRTGVEAASATDRDDLWLEYFGAQEEGVVMSTDTFIKRCSEWKEDRNFDWNWNDLPSVREIESVMRRTKRGKAPGLDQLPSDIFAACPAALARLYHPLFVKTLLNGRQPLQWRGGVLYEAYKRSGHAWLPENHRSLYISSFAGKALHKAMRAKTEAGVNALLHPLHCGTRQGLPVLYPSLYVVTHLRRCAQGKRNAAAVFIDTRAAYYRVVRELVVGDLRSDHDVEKLFHRFGLDGDDVKEMLQLIREGGMMTVADISSPVQAAARDFLKFTWFSTRFTRGDRICEAAAGSRPGASWADCIFAFLYARVLYKIQEVISGEDLGVVLPCNMDAGPFECHPEQRATCLTELMDSTWADDSAYILEDESPRGLLLRTQRVLSIVLTTFRSHGLDPNLKRHKTSMVLRLCGPGSRAARHEFFGSGKAVLKIPDLGEEVHVVLHYKHLGAMLDATASMKQECRHRTALATAAYEDAKDLLLQNRAVSLPTRTDLYQTAVVSTYHNLALWVPEGETWQKLCDGFSRITRRLLHHSMRPEDLWRLPPPLVHWTTGCWPLPFFARRARLSLLTALARNGPPPLWAMLQLEGTWCEVLREDLKWLITGAPEGWPKVNESEWPTWVHLMRDCPARVKRLTRKRLCEDFQSFKENAILRACHWQMYRDVAEEESTPHGGVIWLCRICDRTYRNKAALGVHFFKAHGRCAEYRSYVEGTLCRACNKEFWTSGRLEDHLRAAKKCLRVLQKRFQPRQTVLPGYGSRRRKQNEIEKFTPAAPTQLDEPLPSESIDAWSWWQKRAHELLCDTLLDDFSEVDLEQQVRAVIAKHPLYPEEIQQMLEFLTSEVSEIHAVKELEQWSDSEFSSILQALRNSVEPTALHLPQEPAKYTLSNRDFECLADSYKWSEAISSFAQSHVTQLGSLHQLDDSWRAVWCRTSSESTSTAVALNPLSSLPVTLQQLWKEFVGGASPTLRAPASFWEHPVSRPFWPFRDDLHSN